MIRTTAHICIELHTSIRNRSTVQPRSYLNLIRLALCNFHTGAFNRLQMREL